MTKQQLEQFKKWFYKYVSAFYSNDDELTNDNIRLKEEHTRRMCGDTGIIAEALGLNEEQKILAETISLFHDVGRFEQFKKYRTYNDARTINHSLLGLEVLADNKILDGVGDDEKNIIETAIRLHGEKDLPAVSGEAELFAKLIRDIDKLDIYYVLIEKFNELGRNPKKAMATLGFSIENTYSKNVVEAVLKNQTVDYKDLKTVNDMTIIMLGWIFDINFAATLKEIKKRGFIDKLISFLPDNEDIRKVTEHIRRQLDKRIANNQ